MLAGNIETDEGEPNKMKEYQVNHKLPLNNCHENSLMYKTTEIN